MGPFHSEDGLHRGQPVLGARSLSASELKPPRAARQLRSTHAKLAVVEPLTAQVGHLDADDVVSRLVPLALLEAETSIYSSDVYTLPMGATRCSLHRNLRIMHQSDD
jgi:hypothetical protein